MLRYSVEKRRLTNDDYALESYTEEPLVYPEIFETETSEGSYEQYTTVVGPGMLSPVAEGASIPEKQMVEGFTIYIANFKFGDEFPITTEAQDDNRKIKGLLKEWGKNLGAAARERQETEHADIFNFGGYTAGHATFLNDLPGGQLTTSYGNLCYDSKPFFNLTGNARTAKSGGTYYNGIATLPLNSTNLQVLYKLMTVTNSYNEAGVKVSITPDVLLCQFGSDTYFTAKRILESSGEMLGAHSGVENVWKSKLRLVGWPYLTDSNVYFIGTAKKGLKSLARLPLSIDYYEDKKHDADILRARIRIGRGVTNFRYWAGAEFATS